MASPYLVEVEGLCVDYRVGRSAGGRGHRFRAVDSVNLTIPTGSVYSLVGESGSGKTSLGRTIAHLQPAAAGRIRLGGRDVTTLSRGERRQFRRDVQVIFQDPFSSLDPRMTVWDTITEPLVVNDMDRGAGRDRRVAELMDLCGLNAALRSRRPHELSGGQRQRVGIARALVMRPKFLICDEPVSALDASVQAQILNLLMDLREQMGLTYLFIAHNLGVIRHISDQVAIMYLGTIVESGPRDTIFANPRHPYTQALLLSAPIPDPASERAAKRKRIVLRGDIPSAAAPPSGCRFHTRCWLYQQLDRPSRCVEEATVARELAPGHASSCHFAESATFEGLAAPPDSPAPDPSGPGSSRPGPSGAVGRAPVAS
jgi:peptide/nickel transport system ATP-binding protein/oligopeptide transport system ATP-binding protein